MIKLIGGIEWPTASIPPTSPIPPTASNTKVDLLLFVKIKILPRVTFLRLSVFFCQTLAIVVVLPKLSSFTFVGSGVSLFSLRLIAASDKVFQSLR